MLRYPSSTVKEFYAFTFRYNRFSEPTIPTEATRSLFRSKKDIHVTIGSRVIPAGTINAGYV